MSAEDVVAAVRRSLGDDAVTVEESFGQTTVDVAAEQWVAAATALRDDPASACDFFDWLSAYDAGDDNGGGDDAAGGSGILAVVLHVWSTTHHHHVLLRTRVAGDGGVLPTLTSLWAGAGWHERETFEMFGLRFDGHPNLVPLLLPDGFEGHPLRKDFVLASRVAKAWPGAKEPGESDADAPGGASPGRRRMLPPGVPAEWGPS